MSAISDYADLLVASQEQGGRNDLAHLFLRFVSLAEVKLNRMLRVSHMDTTANVTVTAGTGTLPTDFLEMREARQSSVYPALRAMDLQALDDRYPSSGIPAAYAIVGATIHVRPTWTGTLPITYYAKIPALTVAAPTNWLLLKAPAAYLYAVVEQTAIWERDAEKARASAGLLMNEVMSLQADDNRSRFGNSKIAFGGCTP